MMVLLSIITSAAEKGETVSPFSTASFSATPFDSTPF